MAEGVAACRAIESMRPESERVIYDPYALLLLGDKCKKMISNPFMSWLGKIHGKFKFPGFYDSIIARIRFMNECIKECFSVDYTQLVILGAGYDMSAYCFRDILNKVKIFEVNHPNTHNNKITKLKEYIQNIPDNITYVPVNFETDNLKDPLIKSGYAPSEKTLFIWEGVIYYLEKESVKQTLDFIVDNSAKGSKLAFDYFPPEIIDGTSTDRLGKELCNLVTRLGDPFKFGIKVDDIDKFLKHHRFNHIYKCSSREVRDNYFHGKNKRRKVSHIFDFVCATS